MFTRGSEERAHSGDLGALMESGAKRWPKGTGIALQRSRVRSPPAPQSARDHQEENPRYISSEQLEAFTLRLAAKTDKTAGPDGCWPWLGSATQKDGYGRLSILGRDYLAAKLSLEVKLGRWLAPGEVTRHTCDNPRCCNPAHLLSGSKADNNRDCVERRRRPWGEGSVTAKLTAAQVAEIRGRVSDMGYGRYEALGQMYGVSGRQIANIVKGEAWKRLGAPAAPDLVAGRVDLASAIGSTSEAAR